MDGLQLVFHPPLNSLKIDQRKGLSGPLPDYAYSVKSFTGRSTKGSNMRQDKIAKKSSKLNELPGNSCSQSSLVCSNSSGLFPDGAAAVHSSDMLMSNSKADKSVKKNSRKKARKKGRQSKRQSSDSGSTEPEVLTEEYASVGMASETCSSNDVDKKVGVMQDSTGPEFLFSDDRLMKNECERNEKDGTIDLSEAPKSSSSYIDEVEISKAIATVVQKSAVQSDTSNSKNQLQNRGPIAVIDGETKETQLVEPCFYNDICSRDSSIMHDSLGLDSVLVGANSDDKQSNKASCGIASNSGDGYFLGQNLLNGIGNNRVHKEGIRHVGQNCISNDKRVKQKRTVSKSSSCNKFGGVGILHSRTGKENSHSVWKKVQKNGSDECGGDLKKVNSTLSQFDSTEKRDLSVNRNCNVIGASVLSTTEDRKHLKNKVGRKSKEKIDPVSMKGYCSYSRKGSHYNRPLLNDNEKVSVQQNGMSHLFSREKNQQGLSGVSGSHSDINCPKVGFQTNRIEQIASDLVHNAKVHPEESDSDPLKSACHTISTMKNESIEIQDSSLAVPFDHINQINMSEKQSLVSYNLLGNEVGQREEEVPSADYNAQNCSYGSTLWTWIPIGKKDSGLAISECDSLSLECSDEPNSKNFSWESNLEPKVASFCQNCISSLNPSRTCMGQTYSNFSCLDEDENKKLGNQVACTLTENRDKHDAANHLIYEYENQDAIENCSYRIAQAVNDACRTQLACKTVQIATGGPIAEFERLLHFCSPVICQSPNPLSCLICSQDHIDGVPVSRHEMPDLSLGCLWQWYEKHGSYGLEIRAQDYENPKMLGGVGHFPFCAYFVPSLSAIQLYKNHDKFPNGKVSEACEMSVISEHSSTASQHSICSVHFSQPRNQDASIQKPTNLMHCAEVCYASAKDNVSGASIKLTCSGDLELLFEYFESEQPQQRRPLYEKIQELVRDDITTQFKTYGDPTKLDSINLQDLHPRSWYSVAWYPIYRIPDGNFRAAFLTYHSLGHLVHRSTKFDLPTVDSCIVSPVVGLQSYNAQVMVYLEPCRHSLQTTFMGECWFQLRHSALTMEMLGLNPSALLEERLRTLEETASLMARAVVNKGNLTCTNRHPDYEFFLSRRRF